MINNPVLVAIGTLREASMTDTISFLERVLVEHTSVIVLTPGLRVHGILAYKFELAKTVVPVVATCCRVDDESLICLRVRELFWSFVRRQAIVDSPAERSLFPRVGRYGYDLTLGEIGDNSPGIAHLSNAEIGWPGRKGGVPARIYMIQPGTVGQVSAVNRELIVSVELAFHGVVARERIAATALEHVHPMIYCRAIERAEHIDLWGGRICMQIREGSCFPGGSPYRSLDPR
jgi:hypothetical protein